MKLIRNLSVAVVLLLVVSACSDDDAGTTTDAPAATTEAPGTTAAPATTGAPTTTTTDEHEEGDEHDEADHEEGEGEEGEEHGHDATFNIEAPEAEIVVDLDIADWAGIPGVDLTLDGIEGESVESKDVTVKVAYDHDFIYMLVAVEDDYDWNPEDLHLSASLGVLWEIDEGAGPHMGSDAEGEQEDYVSLGMVDIWHWELECDFGVESGGAVSGPGEGNRPGNDAACNFDDEYATDPETREDDDTESGENSLLGVWMHTNPIAGADGTWYFEMSRPLQTDDPQDAQFTVGDTALMALAYWDADNSPEGWDDAEHVQSSTQGWIGVTLEDH